MLAFLQTTVVPTVPERFGILVTVFKTICPVPLGESVRSSLLRVVISVATPERVRVPVEVIAPEEMVPILARFPPASILCVSVFSALLSGPCPKLPRQFHSSLDQVC